MKYLALLRGINVGGNTIISMKELKKVFESCGYTSVSTYINSGNVVFESSGDTRNICSHLEVVLKKEFTLPLRIVVRTYEEIKNILQAVPKDWKDGENLRKYIAFVKEPVTPQDILQDIHIKDGVDYATIGKHVVYMSTKLEGLTKSGFTKLAGKKIYQDITIRNYTTVQKVFILMGKQ